MLDFIIDTISVMMSSLPLWCWKYIFLFLSIGLGLIMILTEYNLWIGVVITFFLALACWMIELAD